MTFPYISRQYNGSANASIYASLLMDLTIVFTLRSACLSVLILVGAYLFTFGLPEFMSGDASSGGGSAVERPRGGGGGPGRGRGGATTVVLTPLSLQPYAGVMRAVGSAEAINSVTVNSSVAGEVTSVNVKANAVVAKGDVLVQLESKTQNLNLEIAKVKRDQAQATVTRYARLRAGGSSAVTNVEYTESRSDLALAEAEVGLAQIALDDRTIRAPIAGRLGMTNIEVGQVIAANSSIVTIDQSEALLVEFELPERSLALLATERKVLASTPLFTGRVFEGDIVSSDSRIDSVTRSVTVQARIDNSKGELWPGMTFSVRIIHTSEPLQALPSTAVTWSRNGSSIWIEQEGAAHQVPATILYRQGETVWIDADVPEGTMVVTEGAQKLREGAKIVDAGAVPSGDKPAKGPAGKGKAAAAEAGN